MTTTTDAAAARTGELTPRTVARLEIMAERASVFSRVLVAAFVAAPCSP
jgi:hypothetical protein